MAVGGAFQRDTRPLNGYRIPRRGQEVGRFRPAALFQLRVDIKLSLGADAILVLVGHIAPVIALYGNSSHRSAIKNKLLDEPN